MITVFVLDVEEFLPVVNGAKADAAINVSGPNPLGYYRLDAANEMRFNRKALGLKPAVWHGILTGGLAGEVTHFDNDDLVIGEGAPS